MSYIVLNKRTRIIEDVAESGFFFFVLLFMILKVTQNKYLVKEGKKKKKRRDLVPKVANLYQSMQWTS